MLIFETRSGCCAAISRDGFRLPGWHGMFGRGVYFADCPLKSLQYAGWGLGHKYMLVCDVEKGRTLVQKTARPDFDPEGGVQLGSAEPAGWSLLPQMGAVLGLGPPTSGRCLVPLLTEAT
jgi:hypothetical protein